MKTATIFDFLSAQNLLVPFLKENKVLQDLEKEDLLVLVEKLLNPPVVEKTIVEQTVDTASSNTFQPIQEEKLKFAVDTDYRQNTVKLSIQDVLNKLVKDGVIPYSSFSKSELNRIAETLGLVTHCYDRTGLQKQWKPTEYGESIGVTPRSFISVNFSIEAYETIKTYLLTKYA